jgi:hypothetical protein
MLIERNGERFNVDEVTLDKRTIFEDRATEFVIAVEYREAGVLVRRDCHVILKQPAVAAESIAGGF